MNTCKTCKHWGNENIDDLNRKCDILSDKDQRFVDATLTSWGGFTEITGVITNPDFGCVKWEKKYEYEYEL